MIAYTKTQAFAEKLALKLGKHITSSRNRIKVTVQKDIVDICTNIDEEVERIAIGTIDSEFPEFNIHSEECGLIDKGSPYTWYLDPIDGTKEFFRDIPLYDTCITLESKEETLIGVVYYPVSKKLWSASINSKSTLNGKRVSVSKKANLNEAFIYFYPPNTKLKSSDFDNAWDTFKEIARKVYRLRGSALNVVDLCYVAQGASDGFISLYSDKFHGWEDVSAGILMVERAGGKVTDIYGNKIKNKDLSNGIVATNGRLHKKILKIIDNKFKEE
jgi:myo-inositol-1(or 4)-monophosphatase